MRPLTAQAIVHIWERGQGRHTLDRALLLLSPAFPKMNWEDLATLTVGQRNTCLFALRSSTFGFTLRALAACPSCACSLEFGLDSRDLCRSDRMTAVEEKQSLSVGSVHVVFRPLTSRDMAAVAHSGSVSAARALLIERCVLEARDGEQRLHSSDLSEDVIAALAERAAEGDPQAEVLLALACPDCGHEWSMIFDIASFFWTEIASEAKRLLHEVHTLARAYGWPEQDILSMSAVRRQIYLEMAS
ncbi:MAG: hypothetical protein QOC96_1624 [Acidobacteriota bacterium]|nr:hypothetical protein [Acidobacteriota bacterium]